MKIVNYLDITLNLNDGSYRPYKNANEETNYIHVNSDHHPSILKQLPKSIEKRLSSLSSSKITQTFSWENLKKHTFIHT